MFNEILDLQNRIEIYENELHSDVDDELDYDYDLAFDPIVEVEELIKEATFDDFADDIILEDTPSQEIVD